MRCCSKEPWTHLAIALLFTTCSPGFAGAGAPPTGKPVAHAGLESAYEAAAADKSLVLLIFGAEWCQPCKLLEKDTLSSPAFLEKAGLLHLVHVDVDADEKTARAFSVSAIPALFVITPERNLAARREGYMKADQMLEWLADARKRVSLGQWEGSAPGDKLAALTRKAAGGSLDPADLEQLAMALEDSDPAGRTAASQLLLAQREAAMPLLLESLTNVYLGRRIAASEVLRKLAPNAPPFDPWKAPSDAATALTALKNWWSTTRRLPPPNAASVPDPSIKASVAAALDALRGDDPVQRAEAMSDLVNRGDDALPGVRDAIKRAERAGDHRTMTVLEDVRWAILIPDALDRQLGGVRSSLARGTSTQQQAAATQLGLAGLPAVRPLAELASGADPLVVEKALRALSTIGGKDVIPAMASLLKAEDSNLRMTAAQTLAHTKNPEATPHLLTVLQDPNEVVACAAVAGLEEINSASSGGKSPAEVADALRKCLADSRWRVRAASAEAAGKMHLTALTEELRKLLDDPDGFVVKTALNALHLLNAQPSTDQLTGISKRLPTLRGDAVELMARVRSPEVVAAVTGLFDSSSAQEKVKILEAIARTSQIDDGNQAEDAWKPLLTSASASPEPAVRRATARALSANPSAYATGIVSGLLADEDPDTRRAAAEAALGILAAEKSPSRSMGHTLRMSNGEIVSGGRPRDGATNQAAVSPAKRADWHAAISRHPVSAQEPPVAIALFLTGDGKSDLPVLASAIGTTDMKTVKWLGEQRILQLVLAKLTLPEGQEVLNSICRAPTMFALAAFGSQAAPQQVADYLLEPQRFRVSVEPAQGEALEVSLQLLLAGESAYGDNRGWSLLDKSPRSSSILQPLAASTNGAWRAAAVYALGRNGAESLSPVVNTATNDPVPGVRAAALQGLGRSLQNDRPALESRLGPFLEDPDAGVAKVAAKGLLSSEVRSAAGMQWQFDMFSYGSINVPGSYSISSDDRPLAPIEGKPAFLEIARRKLAAADPEFSGALILLLAQYGDYQHVERLAPGPSSIGKSDEPELFLTGVALSRDPKYIPALRKIAQSQTQEYELRKVLQAARGMSGPEVRQFRLDINAQIRKSSGNVISD